MAPTPTDLKRLFALSYNVCAYPSCETPLSDSKWPSVMADVCHIRAQRAGGARWDPDYPNVDAFENLILMCPACHRRIDVLEVEGWTVEALEKLKAEHEGRGADAVEAAWWGDDRVLGWLAQELLDSAPSGPIAAPTLQPPHVFTVDGGKVYVKNPNTEQITYHRYEDVRDGGRVLSLKVPMIPLPPAHEKQIAVRSQTMGGPVQQPIIRVWWSGSDGIERSTDYPL